LHPFKLYTRSLQNRYLNRINPQLLAINAFLGTHAQELAQSASANQRLDCTSYHIHSETQFISTPNRSKFGLGTLLVGPRDTPTLRSKYLIHLGQQDLMTHTRQSQTHKQTPIFILECMFRIHEHKHLSPLFPARQILHDLHSPILQDWLLRTRGGRQYVSLQYQRYAHVPRSCHAR
ncbi:hypothetical protein K469DRAFT_781096, partial [Zopfia rhizophila CBS 207.26]